MAADWDGIYRERGMVQPAPSKQVEELVPIFESEGVHNVLDHCCGTGRHVRYLAEKGFYVAGMDNSESAISMAKDWCKGVDNIQLMVSDMADVRYGVSFFDAAISIHGLQYGNRLQRTGAIDSIRWALRRGGIFFLKTISRSHQTYGVGKPVDGDPHTFTENPGLAKTTRHFLMQMSSEVCWTGLRC